MKEKKIMRVVRKSEGVIIEDNEPKLSEKQNEWDLIY